RQRGMARLKKGDTAGVFRLQFERSVVIGDGIVESPELEIDETAAVERVGGVGLELERFTAIGEGRLQLAENGALPTAGVPHLRVGRRELDGLAEIGDRPPPVTLAA